MFTFNAGFDIRDSRHSSAQGDSRVRLSGVEGPVE